ncbi:Aste57867_4712 [Aphanomyces stellatus]|uniref:Aste57867_4712 protein n=1 Tax=Aphanomyces stellatus TaxID=120398 RepID=A0A485KD53_9STRA|nr:hypothetical protein As57867_004699 [Aphanomyces stellatus]VFT81812.1 Aste57867_4712 [Aphanomyces stellatus]
MTSQRRLGDLDVPVYDKVYVHFKDVPRALVQRILAEGDRSKHYEIKRVMLNLGMNRHFDDMWFRAHGKKHKAVLVNRTIIPAKEYTGARVIQRFLERVHLERLRKPELVHPSPGCDEPSTITKPVDGNDSEQSSRATPENPKTITPAL